MIILFSDDDFVWLQEYRLEFNNFRLARKYKSIPVAQAVGFEFFCRDRILIKSMFELSVYNLREKSIDFKIKLSKYGEYDLSCSLGKVAIGRHKHSFCLDVDSART
jgi:hypothetical protein